MITLHKFIPAWGLPDISPFCIKAETYLRMAGFEYRTVVSDSRKAPKGKCPYIEHDGHIICDSSFIVNHLESCATTPLDKELNRHDKAISAAFKALFEEQLYFIGLWSRWVDPVGWKIYRPVLHELAPHLGVPKFLIPLVEPGIRYKIRRSVYVQGTGRHSPDEINTIGIGVISAVSDWLQDKPYMLGDDPHTIDATAYAFLCGWIWGPFDGPIKDHAISLGNLASYCERMKDRYWQTDEPLSHTHRKTAA